MSSEMTGWAALLRGVNVGGGNKVPMADLRRVAEGLGWQGVRTYVASGNLVFRAAGPAERLGADLRRAVAQALGVDVPVRVVARADIARALERCPWTPEAGKHVHVFFLFGPARLDPARYDALRAANEELALDGDLAWLHAPDGIGRSKLAEKLDKVILGADMTARNLNTVRALAEMLDAGGPD